MAAEAPNSGTTVKVTRAQQMAAKGLVTRSAAKGRTVSASVQKIATAKPVSGSAPSASRKPG